MTRQIELSSRMNDAASNSKSLSETPSIAKGFTRRDMVMLVGASVSATSLGGIPDFVTPATAQDNDCGVKTQILPLDNFLAKAAIKAAQGFPMGTEAVNLNLSLGSGILGAVYEFTHPPKEAQ